MFFGQGAGATTTQANITAMAKGFLTCIGFNTCGANGVGMTNSGQNAEDTAIGWEAGAGWTTAQYNTIVGVGSMRIDATGINNSVLGVDDIETSTEANNHDNAVVGVGALRNGGSQNVVIGNSALQGSSAGSTANSNVAIGYNTLSSTAQTTASYNVAIGVNTLDSATSNGNTAVGYNSAVALTTATSVTVVGNSAANAITTGGGVTAVGANALTTYSGTNNNDAFGANAGEFISTGNQSVAVGSGSQQGITGTPTTGNYNSSLGYQSLFKCQGTCTDNTAMGYLAGTNVTTGQYNVLYGWESGNSITTGQGNVCIGFQVCSSTLQTGQKNLIIGTSAAVVDTPANNTSNWLNINNVIAGNMTALTTAALTCGTSPAIDAQASDLNGTITTGSSGTFSTCALAFTTTKSAAPICVVTARSGTPVAYTTSTTALTLTVATNSAQFDYMCSGK